MCAKEKEAALSAYNHIKQSYEAKLKWCEDAYNEAINEHSKEWFQKRIIDNLKNIIDIDNKIINIYENN